jgi:hypothetical protein
MDCENPDGARYGHGMPCPKGNGHE